MRKSDCIFVTVCILLLMVLNVTIVKELRGAPFGVIAITNTTGGYTTVTFAWDPPSNTPPSVIDVYHLWTDYHDTDYVNVPVYTRELTGSLVLPIGIEFVVHVTAIGTNTLESLPCSLTNTLYWSNWVEVTAENQHYGEFDWDTFASNVMTFPATNDIEFFRSHMKIERHGKLLVY